MKKNLLITASVLVLASCAGNSQDVDLTEQNLEIAPVVEHKYDDLNSSMTSYEGIDGEVLDEATLQLREDLAAISDNTVQFEFDSSALTPEAQEELKLVAGFVMAKENIGKITIQGHCDERGTREYNLSLGERRAVSIKKYLVGLGIDSEMIETISFGKEQLADTSNTPAAWAKNRRGVVLLEASK